MVLKAEVINELQIYAAFFVHSESVDDRRRVYRVWYYPPIDGSLLSGKPVFIIENDDCRLMDYSKLLQGNLNSDNYKNFLSNIDNDFVTIHDIKNLKLSEMKEILKNDALVANEEPKIVKQIQMYKNIDEMF